MTLVHANELNLLFENKIRNLEVEFEETRDYILGVYIEFAKKNITLSPQQSITLKFLESNSFIDFQNLGDHLLFCRSIYPKSLNADLNYIDEIARRSYRKCHLLINKSWPVFEELSTNFSNLISVIQI